MDVDNGGENNETSPVEIEQSLLQQFSCMGTTDKDELVKQLQKLLGSNLNYATADFFLEMNNWNLQAAVCSYFDIENNTKLPSMALVSDPAASESENVEPRTGFEKRWHIFNNGGESWPVGCYAKCSDGDCLGGAPVAVPPLRPFEDATLAVGLTSPPVAGVYQSKWRLCTEHGAYFGDPMWMIVTVVEEGSVQLTQQLSHFSELGSSPPPPHGGHNPFVTPQRAQQVEPSNDGSTNQGRNGDGGGGGGGGGGGMW